MIQLQGKNVRRQQQIKYHTIYKPGNGLLYKVLKQQQFQKKASKVCVSPLGPIPGKWYVVNYINTCFQKPVSSSPSFLKHVYEGIIFAGD